MAISIESIDSSQAAVLAAIHNRCFDAPWDAAAFATLLGQPGSFGRIALHGAPVGFVLCRRALDEMEILTLCVLPEMRGRSVATNLLRSALEDARGMGVRSAFLEVAVSNAPALRLYHRAGFAAAGRREAYYRARDGVSVDAVVLSWRCSEPGCCFDRGGDWGPAGS